MKHQVPSEVFLGHMIEVKKCQVKLLPSEIDGPRNMHTNNVLNGTLYTRKIRLKFAVRLLADIVKQTDGQLGCPKTHAPLFPSRGIKALRFRRPYLTDDDTKNEGREKHLSCSRRFSFSLNILQNFLRTYLLRYTHTAYTSAPKLAHQGRSYTRVIVQSLRKNMEVLFSAGMCQWFTTALCTRL